MERHWLDDVAGQLPAGCVGCTTPPAVVGKLLGRITPATYTLSQFAFTNRIGAAMAPRPEFSTDQIRNKARREFLQLLDGVQFNMSLRYQGRSQLTQ